MAEVTGPSLRKLNDKGGCFILSGKNKVVENIRTLLLTPLGTRVNFPEYGSKLHYLNFSLLDDDFDSLANIYIAEAISSCMPGVSIVSIDVIKDQDGRAATIDITFQSDGTGSCDMATLDFSNGKFS